MAQSTVAAPPTIQKRFAAILKWCDKRSINQVYKFFHGCDNELEKHEARIRLVMRTNSSVVVDSDEPWVVSMELTTEAINNRKQAA